MFSFTRAAMLLAASVLVMTLSGTHTVQAAGLMEACKADIDANCKGVREGRGRISACLYAHSNKISKMCEPELKKVTTSRIFERMIPPDVRSKNDTAYEANLRKICASDIKVHCAGVKPGQDRTLACLYAWTNRLSAACRTEAKTVLDHLN
ncbi:cysteine rich repeat-containing protein [Hoeflea sp.]|uniref:cysteine rich repeat-containing protein n=1 Tax=Hoeflea sp. TaxID=1940281 RepID=UPI003B0153C7